jgi:hypothetical protein
MNPANGTTSTTDIKGAGGTWGNAYPMFGTGTVIYTQLGFLLPEKLLPNGNRLMPYASFTSAAYDRLGSERMNVANVGINWLINGHKAKVSLDYQNRPTYSVAGDGSITSGPRRGCATMQYQISF